MFSSIFLKSLNREASSRKARPEKIIEALQLEEGQSIADIGAGGGYFSIEFAEKVGEIGRVYAVDTRPRYLDFVRRQAEKTGLDNIVPVRARGKEMNLPEAGIDLVFARNVFHHLPEPGQYFGHMRRFVKPQGKVAIIEHQPKRGMCFVSLFKHSTPAEVVRREMESAGYSLVKSFDFLSGQTFCIFEVAWLLEERPG